MTVREPMLKVVGTTPIRHDGVDKVKGRAIFGVDVSLPGMLHARVLRSPHAHARIVRIDTSAADRLSGVAAIVTGFDVPVEPIEEPSAFSNPIRLKALNAMAQGTPLYHGHAIAAVAAVSSHVADEALRHIRVEYDVLKPVVDIPTALKPDAPILQPNLRTETAGSFADVPSNVAKHLVLEEGDITAGFEIADVVVERTFSTATVHQGYIEPHNAVAFWRSDGTLELHCSSQGHFGVRNEVSQILGIPISTIRVVPAEIGGGFGGKLTNYVAIPAVLLAQKSGRPGALQWLQCPWSPPRYDTLVRVSVSTWSPLDQDAAGFRALQTPPLAAPGLGGHALLAAALLEPPEPDGLAHRLRRRSERCLVAWRGPLLRTHIQAGELRG